MGLRHIFRLVGTDKPIHTYPKDWWNMFKERYFPQWLVRHFPIEYKEVVAKHMFPYLKETLGEEIVRVYVKDKE
ncbi:hypothetical protein LCGC14_0392580 [marine sediment metagenome]|uniref:Uncharacterized protein n=1 Tax=marine sediment metagenome TaxID=412755 RepID=A0A0F9TGZ0_9ZZZZ